jgi:hypothetical protein
MFNKIGKVCRKLKFLAPLTGLKFVNNMKSKNVRILKAFFHVLSCYFSVFKLGCGRGEACTGFWWGNLRERDHWGDTHVDGRIILRWIFKK